MRNKFLFILALPFLFTACKKSSSSGNCGYTTTTAVAPAGEIANLKAAMGADTLTFTQHSSGLFYKISSQGTGSVPGVCSDVTVKYSGRLINSSVPFDSNTTGVTFTLGQLISGWQIGIPLIKKGGSIILYIPPSLGYGSTGAGSAIPPNSNLVFTVDLINLQ